MALTLHRAIVFFVSAAVYLEIQYQPVLYVIGLLNLKHVNGAVFAFSVEQQFPMVDRPRQSEFGTVDGDEPVSSESIHHQTVPFLERLNGVLQKR